jgi:hypothetical protein
VLGFLRYKISALLGKSWERSLVIEETANHFEVFYTKLYLSSKKIVFLKRKKVKGLEELRRPLFLLDKLIFALDSHHATTIESVIRLKRPQPQEIINEAELDHLVFRCLWDFLNRYRGWAARKMRVSDLDVVLANIEVRDVGLGNHRMLNPLGFKGAEFFLRLNGTFIPRSILATINSFRKWASDFVVVESGSIVSFAIPESANLVIHPTLTKTTVFLLGEEERLFSREFFWGFSSLCQAIAKNFYVSEDLAQEILSRYMARQVSPKVYRLIRLLVRRELRTLLDLINNHYNKNRGNARLTAYFNFRDFRPPEFVFPNFYRFANFSKWLELQGFQVIYKTGAVRDRVSAGVFENALALLTYNYHYEHYNFLNQLMKRRARWLTVSNSTEIS